MKYLIILFALALSACTTTQPVTTQSSSGMAAFGTLASSDNPIEMQAAPVYSSLARLFHNAEVRLRQGRITVDQARQIDRDGSEILAALDSAVLSRNADSIGKTAQKTKAVHQLMGTW